MGTTTAAYVMGTSVVISVGGADEGEILYVGLLDEAPLGSANQTIIGGIASGTGLCGARVLLTLVKRD